MSPEHALLYLGIFVLVVGAWVTHMVKWAHNQSAKKVSNQAQLEERVRVLEQIVTDSGARTAAQIEALASRKDDAANESP